MIFINNTINFLEDNMAENESIKGQDKLKNFIKEFKCKYYPYKNIRRFSIPVIGCVGSGKSTILNYLLRLRKTLEVSQQITTKCICIIRHQKGNKNAKIYKVNIKRRGKINDGLYNFEKGEEIKENVAEVIAERNKLIAENKVGYDYEKYFLIIEYEIPFFIGEMEKYAEILEFMDVPGLNERSEIKESLNYDNSNESISSNITTNFYFSQIFPLIRNNIKFSLFIFGADIYDKKNAKEILLGYINENSIYNKEQNLINNSYKEQPKLLEIKTKKLEEKKEQRKYCSLESFKESIFILNKLDMFNPKEREIGNQRFREYIKNEFRGYKDKLINLDDDNEIGIIGKKLNEEISKNDSFEEYLNYYNSNSKEFEGHSNNFYEYIAKMMNKDFNLKIKIKKEEIVKKTL